MILPARDTVRQVRGSVLPLQQLAYGPGGVRGDNAMLALDHLFPGALCQEPVASIYELMLR